MVEADVLLEKNGKMVVLLAYPQGNIDIVNVSLYFCIVEYEFWQRVHSFGAAASYNPDRSRPTALY